MSLTMSSFPKIRMRRLRSNPVLRNLVRECHLDVSNLIFPLFIHHGANVKTPIHSMPGQYQLSLDQLAYEIREIVDLGIPGVLLFGIPAHKDAHGSRAINSQGLIQMAISTIKDLAPNLLVISDLCFCEYTDHGHCGIISERTGQLDVDNDETLELLVAQAISHAEAGVDVVAPSGMIDGMVAAIRTGLDQAGFDYVPILSYAAKYCSALYGPFRDAALGAPKFGDRRTYQMDPSNAGEALRESALDIEEGADMLMVKPAHTYLDIINAVKSRFPYMPLAAYHVSGEYAMIKAAAEQGWINEQQVVNEILTSIKRAGADFIISYYAKEFAYWFNE